MATLKKNDGKNMNYKLFLNCIILSLLAFVSPHTLYSGSPASPMPEMSEAELRQLEQQMEAEINAFVSSLPPEQQEQFYQDVEALTEEMSKMSEDELNEFIDNVFTEPTPPPLPEGTTVETPAQPSQRAEPTKKPQKTPKRIPRKQIDHITTVLDKITEHINNLLQKSETIVDFQRKIEKWARVGFIPQWNTDTVSWSDVQRISVQLAQKIKSLLARDPKTKNYYFIEKLLEDKGLINNLELFNKKLSEEINIIVPELDLSDKAGLSLTRKSKQAIRTTVDSILEAYNLLKLQEAIDQLIASFGPIAEKIKKEEADAIKQAIEALKQRNFPASVRVLGQPEANSYTGPTYRESRDYGYRPSRYDAPYNQNRRDGYKQPANQEKTTTKPDKRKQNGKTKTPTKSISKPSTPKSPAEERASKHIEKIEINLEEARDALEEIGYEKGFPKTLTQKSKTGPKDTIIDSFSTLQSSLKNATTAIRSFNTSIKSLPAATKTKLTNQVKKSVKGPLEKIKKFKKQLEKVEGKMTDYPMATKVTVSIGSLERAFDRIGKK